MEKLTRRDLFPINFSPYDMKTIRQDLNLTQEDIGNIVGVSKAVICNIEAGRMNDPLKLLAYQIILERIMAYHQGYVPAYRKVGTNEYI